MTCAACGETMPPEGEWHVLRGLAYHVTGSCGRVYQRRLRTLIRLMKMQEGIEGAPSS